MKLEDIVWLACAIDSEGSIGIHKDGIGYYRPVLTVYNTNLEYVSNALSILRGEIGVGHLETKRHRPGSLGNRTLYACTLRGGKVLSILEIVLPYLIVKRNKALEMLVPERLSSPEDKDTGEGKKE